ncbi:replication factor C large subunit [Candidatus Woesearchaeota archaeon]|nr:replication factor C large subunit [Candidatus Woesearchaeota archaeon]
MSIPWTRKYEPKSSSEVQGQDKSVQAIKDFIQNFSKSKVKALLLYGPTGCGKTAAVHAVANELGLELLEVNASDSRNTSSIEDTVGSASKQMSLFGRGKVILVDEVDGLAGREDRGGVSQIIKVIKETGFPIILTANDPFDSKLSSLRKVCELVQFRTLAYTSVYNYLKKVCNSESIDYDEDDLKSLARRLGGDLRGAITDLQTLTNKTKKLDKEALDELSGRRQTESMIKALMKIFKTTDPEIALTALDNVDEDLSKAFLWIDENLPKEYTKAEDLYRAYDALSKADVFNGRIRKWQHWRFLVYISNLLTAGVAIAKDEKYKGFCSYQPTKRILKLWQANMKNQKKKAIAAKIAVVTHSSARQVIKHSYPFFKQIFMQNPEKAEVLAREFDLDKDEVAYLNK